jgi:hypothetical protein
VTADTPRDPGERFTRRPREPRSEGDLEVPPRQAFDAELDAITDRVSRVVAAGRTAFIDGSPGYDVASMAIIRLAGLFEVRRFHPFLAGVTPIEQRSIKASRQYAAHGGYREMDDEFWHTITIDVPELVSRLRNRG